MALGLNWIGLLCLSNKHTLEAAVFMPADFLDYLSAKSKRICRSEISDNTLPPLQGLDRITDGTGDSELTVFMVLYCTKKTGLKCN